MEINSTFSNEKFNFEEKLRPLFEAMKEGKKIKSVTCMNGRMNKDNREKDFTIKDFIAEDYWVGLSSNYDGDYFDYVTTNKKRSDGKEGAFYMNWVLSFEL